MLSIYKVYVKMSIESCWQITKSWQITKYILTNEISQHIIAIYQQTKHTERRKRSDSSTYNHNDCCSSSNGQMDQMESNSKDNNLHIG